MRLSQATHSLVLDLRVPEFQAVQLERISESISSQEKSLYGKRIQVQPAGKLSPDYLRKERERHGKCERSLCNADYGKSLMRLFAFGTMLFFRAVFPSFDYFDE
jgi:hypothetical protein